MGVATAFGQLSILRDGILVQEPLRPLLFLLLEVVVVPVVDTSSSDIERRGLLPIPTMVIHWASLNGSVLVGQPRIIPFWHNSRRTCLGIPIGSTSFLVCRSFFTTKFGLATAAAAAETEEVAVAMRQTRAKTAAATMVLMFRL